MQLFQGMLAGSLTAELRDAIVPGYVGWQSHRLFNNVISTAGSHSRRGWSHSLNWKGKGNMKSLLISRYYGSTHLVGLRAISVSAEMLTGHILNTVIWANLFDGMVALLGLQKLLCHYQPKLTKLHLPRDNFLIKNAGIQYSNINKKICFLYPYKRVHQLIQF
jgi:hypothetical protein